MLSSYSSELDSTIVPSEAFVSSHDVSWPYLSVVRSSTKDLQEENSVGVAL